MKRLSLACVIAGLLLAAAPARAADPPLDLERLTVAEAGSKMAAGQLTSVQLTRAYINRIAATNARGPGFNAVRIVNPRALTDASLLDLERATGKVRGPLHGVPVLVKDNLDVAGLPTTAGNVALQNSVPDKDSTVVARLAGRRRRDPRQDEPDRVRELHVHHRDAQRLLEPRRAGAQPLRPRLRHQRVERRLRRRGRRRPRRGHDRHRDVRLDRRRRRRCRASSGCGRRSASSAGPASCRSPPRRTRPAR